LAKIADTPCDTYPNAAGVLINENLEMREQVERLELRLKGVRLGEGGGIYHGDGDGGMNGSAALDEVHRVGGEGSPKEEAPPHVGMLKFAEKDVQLVVNAIVTNLSPEMVMNEAPGLPAHLLFMCVLYADHVENTAMMHGLLHKSFMAIKQVVMGNTTNLHVLAFWLTNAHRLLCDMKQFSGEAQFRSRNDTTSITLKSFDLAEWVSLCRLLWPITTRPCLRLCGPPQSPRQG